MPRKSKSPQITKLFLLTLTLEEAIAEERWEEASSLFEQRDKVLEILDASELDGLEEVQQAEVRLMRALRGQRASLVLEIAAGRSGSRVGSTYTNAVGARGGYDLAS